MPKGLRQIEAFIHDPVACSVIDFGITQIVDQNVGLHSIIPKWPFNASAWQDEPYYQVRNFPHSPNTNPSLLCKEQQR